MRRRLTGSGLAALGLVAPFFLGAATMSPAAEVATSEAAAPATPPTSRRPGVRLALRTMTSPDGRLTFVGTLVNDGPRTVTLVEPGDGSDVGWRTPIITWKVETPDGVLVPPRPQGPRCVNVNRLRDGEIFALAPGKQHVLSAWLGEPDAPPGTYVIRLVYENDPSQKPSGVVLGSTSGNTLDRIAESTPCKVESAPATAEIPARGRGPLTP